VLFVINDDDDDGRQSVTGNSIHVVFELIRMSSIDVLRRITSVRTTQFN